ncbi:MAG: phosphatidyl-myo-inositol dimannoside synthase [Baekduia sp.]|nr:phosphatidyl-myo-inositol dimannoside synthase [Baekduia sp.]
MPRVLVVRGHQATPWDLHQWEALPARFDVAYLRTEANGWDVGSVGLEAVPVGTRRDRLPKGRVGDIAALLAGDRYGEGADEAYAAADIVHAEELAYWFSADAARAKARHGFKLVQTVWETLPMLRTYRRGGLAKLRDEVLAATDLFLPSTERARIGLLLEGVPEEKLAVCAPGIDVERFAAPGGDGTGASEHLIVAPGRLVWEKGHHDALRAIALLHRGIVTLPNGTVARPRLQIVGSGPEEGRLRAYAAELGIADAVSFGSVPYDDMPDVFARASALLLGSQSSALGGRHPLDIPRAFWEEQFGFVFVEAMAAGLDIVATTNGAIPEVLDGQGTLVAAGDYIGMARALAAGPLSRPPGERVAYPPDLLQHYSVAAFAERLTAAYDRVLA